MFWLTIFNPLLVSAADGKVDGCKFLCLVRCSDFDIIGAPQVERAGHLAVAVCRSVILVRGRGCQVCCDTILECKGLGLISLSGVVTVIRWYCSWSWRPAACNGFP